MRAQDCAGRVLHGTCGWSDASIVSCGRFYPRSVKTSADKLSVHCRTFGCVEVDSSCYSIPSKANVAKWVQSVPTGYVFHFKAFGLFCSQKCAANMLPRSVREPHQQASVRLSEMTSESVDRLWQAFHSCLQPAKESGKLGCVLFQFHLTFTPSEANKQHVEWCRSRLDPSIDMAVEFRARAWFHPDAADTVAWLTGLGISMVAADELRHETFQPDRAQTGLPPGEKRELMPIALHVTDPRFFYIRLHRRAGTKDRIVDDTEHEAWARRLQALRPRLQGPVYFLWGTEWEDAPVVNAARLQAALPPDLCFDWPAFVRRAAGGRPSIAGLFAASPTVPKAADRPKAAAASPDQDCAAAADSGCHADTVPAARVTGPGQPAVASRACAAIAAPPGTTWLPPAKAQAALAAAGGSDGGPRVTGAANIARTFAARAQVIPAALLPVRAPEPARAEVCGAMDAFVTRSHGKEDAGEAGTEGSARVQEHRDQAPVHAKGQKAAMPARTTVAAGVKARSEVASKRKRPSGGSAVGQQQNKMKQAGIQGFMRTS